MERSRRKIKKRFLQFFIDADSRIVALFGIAFFLSLFFILLAQNVPNSSRYHIGDNAKNTIRSEYTFLYTDHFESEKLFLSIESNKPHYYSFNSNFYKVYETNLNRLLNVLNTQTDQEFYKRMEENNLRFSRATVAYLIQNRLLLTRYTNRINYLYKVLTSQYTIIDELGESGSQNSFTIIKNNVKNELPRAKVLVYPLDLEFMNEFIGKNYTGMGPDFKSALAEILANLVQPNAYRNPKARNDIILAEIELLRNQKIIHQKEYILRPGEVITQETLAKIIAYTDYKKADLKTKRWIFAALSLVLYLFFIYRFFKYERKTFTKKYNISVSLIAFVFVNFMFYFTRFYSEISFLPEFLLMPYAIISITLPLLLKNARVAIILLIMYSFYLLFYPAFSVITFLNLIVISFSTIYTSQILKNRTDFFVVALLIGVIELIFSGVYIVYYQMKPALGEWGVIVLFSFGNALVSAIVGLGLMPLLENMLNIPTRFRLLELTNPTTSPLLKLLKAEAHGTYNHSLLLGDMCEAAAERIGIDSLLARAGGYFHDIGKTEIPQYFSENQEGENLHDEIKPSMSVSVIKSHVKLGVEIARKYHLPEEVIEYIREHHGTTAISYFYHQALGLFGDENVNIEDYEYPGPKPQSKGTAILMLADGVEASVRAYSQNNERFTTKIIQDIIDDIIEKRMQKGQFDECDITLHDLRIIADEFNKFLSGYYHKRIEYLKNRG